MLDDGYKAVRVVIFGKVQGVFFRDWTVGAATELSLDGWVRNRADGSVEAMFVGPDDDVDKMLENCKAGSAPSKVSNIEISPARGITKKGFHQKPTVDINERRGL